MTFRSSNRRRRRRARARRMRTRTFAALERIREVTLILHGEPDLPGQLESVFILANAELAPVSESEETPQ